MYVYQNHILCYWILSVILEIKMPIVNNQSLELVGTYLQPSCDQPEVYNMYVK